LKKKKQYLTRRDCKKLANVAVYVFSECNNQDTAAIAVWCELRKMGFVKEGDSWKRKNKKK
jgi:hypothetical protein